MLESNKILEPAVVLDVDDPMMLNRVRARVLTIDYDAVIKSITNPVFNEITDKWGERDPFVFTPLLPYYLYATPKVDELIQVLFVNKEYKFDNQYYIQPNLSSPMVSPFDYYLQGGKYTGTGKRFKGGVPIKNIDGSHVNPSNTFGVFPEPGDNALMGRGSSDIIVKKNEILLRSGKIKGEFSKNKLPVSNTNRAFIQLSKFDSDIVEGSKDKYSELNESVLYTKYLIEWYILNPENTQNSFSGSIYVYNLKIAQITKTSDIGLTSDLEDIKTLANSINFTNLSLSDTITFINNFIYDCNNGVKTRDGKVIFNSEDRFPIFFRPSPINYSVISSDNSTSLTNKSNLLSIFNKIKLFNSSEKSGYGLIYSKNLIGKQYTVKTKIIQPKEYVNQSRTYSAIGADKVYLLSHNSAVPRKGKINFDGSIYGIDSDKFVNEIDGKTSSMVRGEELLELINLIVRFLLSHTHSFPGLPPVSLTEDGSSAEKLTEEFANAVNKILNKNIRIN